MRIDPTNRNTALASVFVDELARAGVTKAVVCPGSRSTPLALAFEREPRIELTVVIDERSAGFAALGMTTATEQPVPVITTSGTAAANLHPAVCEADLSHAALIALTSDRPPELRGIGAGQTIDQIKLFGNAVRWFCEVGNHDADDDGLLHFRSVAARAAGYARDRSNPGPVHLNLAWREPLAPSPDPAAISAELGIARDGRSDGRPLSAVTERAAAPPAKVVEPAAEYVSGVEKGLILAGRQRDPDLGPKLAALSARTGFPILAEPTSQARTRSAGDVIWAYDWIARLGPSALRPELILRFGEFPTSKALRSWLGGTGTVEQIAFLEAGWNDPTAQTSGIVRARPADGAAALVNALDRPSGDASSDWAERWRSAQAAAAAAVDDALGEAPGEPGVHRALARLYGDDDIVYTASSMPIRDQEFFLPTLEQGPLFLANRGANGIDGLVSSGIGAAIATGRPAWIITGDLGFVHDASALMTLGQAAAPVRIVVINNDGGGIFEHLTQAEILDRAEFERLFITPSGVDLVPLCAAHGVDYVRIDELEQLADLPESSCVAEVPTDGRADARLRSAVAERTRDAIVDALSIT